jgi:cytochrome c biogenesis protein CcdA
VTGLLVAAFAAGMVATVNPCGFAMLPAYLGLFIGEKGPSRRSALAVGVSVSVGFVAVFLVAGLLVASGIRAIVGWLPWLAAVVGVGLIVVGVGELRGTHLLGRLPGVKRAPSSRSFVGLVGFGASYGVASLSCTLPIFLSLTAGAVAGRSLVESTAVFLSYGAGMSLVVIALTIFLAVGRENLLRRIRPLASHLGTISGWTLILAGGFIVWYWATVLGTGAETLGENPIVRWIEQTSSDVAQLVASNPATAAVVISGVAFLGWISIRHIGTRDLEHHEAEEESERVGS